VLTLFVDEKQNKTTTTTKLKNFGLCRLSNNAEQENFVLREAYYKFFDPYFFHFRRSDREKAEEVLRERRKKGKSTEPFTPPPFIPLKAPFASLENLLHSKTLCQVLFYGLLHNFSGFATPQANPASTPQRSQSATVLDMCLHLITLALSHSKIIPGTFTLNATTLQFEVSPTEVSSSHFFFTLLPLVFY